MGGASAYTIHIRAGGSGWRYAGRERERARAEVVVGGTMQVERERGGFGGRVWLVNGWRIHREGEVRDRREGELRDEVDEVPVAISRGILKS